MARADRAARAEAREVRGESLRVVYYRRFKKHALGKIGVVVLLVLYLLAVFADFLAPYTMIWTDKTMSFHPPSKIRLLYRRPDGRRVLRPYVYEQRIVNQAFKRYEIVPPETLRVVSEETAPYRAELRVVAVDKSAGARKARILRAVSNRYGLAQDSAAIRDLSTRIDRFESHGAVDVTERVELRDEQGVSVGSILLTRGNKNFLRFFARGVPYRFWNLFPSRIHFLASPTGGYYPIGADNLGRDVWSRVLHGSRISLSIGLIGIAISFTVGLLIGGVSGYFGGTVDVVLMRIAEVVMSFPGIYLLFALRATFPPNLNAVQVYLLIVVILSFTAWGGLSRIIRGMVLSIKNEEFVLSAKAMGLSHLKIIIRHILKNTMSFVIIQATLTIPGFILGESALSLLGLGITDPQSSWGLMLSAARNTRIIKDFPWILIPGFFIFFAIMAWNFVGDGIRDAVDPHSRH